MQSSAVDESANLQRQAQQDADKVDVQPREPEFNTGNQYLDALLTNTHYLGVDGGMDNAIIWHDSLIKYQRLFIVTKEQSDPAMAGDELLSASSALSKVFWAAPLDYDKLHAVVMRLDHARKRVQPASGSISNDLLKFLHGSGEIDGVWFGDRHPEHRGRFWWRALLPQSGEVQPASGEDALPARATTASAPNILNTNDKAFWTLGWNDCLDSMQQGGQS